MMIVSKKGVNYNMSINKNEIIPHWGRPSGLDGRQRCPGGNEQYERTIITLMLFHFDVFLFDFLSNLQYLCGCDRGRPGRTAVAVLRGEGDERELQRDVELQCQGSRRLH